MTSKEVVLAKAERVRRRLDRLRQAIGVERSEFLSDIGRVEQAAFNVFLAMQECVDLASHIVADEGWGAPNTLGEVFDILEKRGVLGSTTSAAMRRGVKLRNLIAHAYAEIDADRLYESASAGLVEIQRFLGEIGGWLSGTGPVD